MTIAKLKRGETTAILDVPGGWQCHDDNFLAEIIKAENEYADNQRQRQKETFEGCVHFIRESTHADEIEVIALAY